MSNIALENCITVDDFIRCVAPSIVVSASEKKLGLSLVSFVQIHIWYTFFNTHAADGRCFRDSGAR